MAQLLPFVKMEGAGNDYICVDALGHSFDYGAAPTLAVQLSDRHRGIGADGLIVLAPSERADCRMLMWNADGSRGQTCGNGLRCLGKLAYELGHVCSMTMTIECDAGVRDVELISDDRGEITGARVDMGEVHVELEPKAATLGGTRWSYHRGDAGNPHAVIFCEESLDDVPVAEVGAAFQELPEFPQGVNVEFVHATESGALLQRTYERGSAETMACGSGATVAALAATVTGRVSGPEVSVELRGGTLVITCDRSHLVMEGPARTVFRGEVSIGAELGT